MATTKSVKGTGLFAPRPPGRSDDALAWLADQALQSPRASRSRQGWRDLVLRRGFAVPPGEWRPPEEGAKSQRSPLAGLAERHSPALAMLLLTLWLVQLRHGPGAEVPALNQLLRDIEPWKTTWGDEITPSWALLIWGEDHRGKPAKWRTLRRDSVADAWRRLQKQGFVLPPEEGVRFLLMEDGREPPPGRTPEHYRVPRMKGEHKEMTFLVPAGFITEGWLRVLPAHAVHTYLVLLANRNGRSGMSFITADRGGPTHRTYSEGTAVLRKWQLIEPCEEDRERVANKGRLRPEDRGKKGPIHWVVNVEAANRRPYVTVKPR